MAFIGKNPKFNTGTLVPQSTAPANPVEGMIYYDDGTTNTEGVYKFQNGSFEFISSLIDFLKLNPLAADPTSPIQGQIQYSDGTVRSEGLWSYNGTDWVPVGSQGGTLSIIYQEDFEAATKAADLVTGQNPIFDNGGVLAGTLADETASPLSGRNSISYTIGGSTNDFFHTGEVTLPVKSIGSTIEASVHAKFSGNDDVIRFVLWDDTNDEELSAEFIQSTDSREYRLISKLPTSCLAIKIGFHASGTGTSGDILVFDDIEITQNPFSDFIENNLTDFTPYTPSNTQGFGTITSNQLHFREEGDAIRIIGSFVTGTTSAIEAQLELPAGYTTNSSFTNITSAGEVIRNISSTNARQQTALIQNDLSYLRFAFTAGATALTPQNGNSMFGSGERLSFEVIVPVNELSVNRALIVKNSQAANSSIRVSTGNGYGTTNTNIPRWSNIIQNVGNDIELIQSAADGDSFLIKTDGVYNICTNMFASSLSFGGVTLNSSELSTGFSSLVNREDMIINITNGAGEFENGSAQLELKAGDVIRPHTDGAVNTSDFNSFIISKVGATQLTGIPYTSDVISLEDGVSEPSTRLGFGQLYIDSIDGDLKIKFGDGTIKTIVTDS